MSRLTGAIDAMCDIIREATGNRLGDFGRDDDLAEDLGLKTLEFVSIGLIIEEIFSIDVPDNLFDGPLYRTPAALAEWAIKQSDAAAWAESQRQRRA